MLRVGFTPQAGVMQNSSYNKKSNNNPSFGDALLIIKPEVFTRSKSIINKIQSKGYEVTDIVERRLTKEEAQAHYKELFLNAQQKLQEGNDFLMGVYNKVIKNLTSGKVTTAIVKGDEETTAAFKKFTGATSYKSRDPESLRGQIERSMIKKWTKQGKSQEEIEALRDAYTFTHASDTNFFPGTSIKNYDYEIGNLYKNKQVK